MTKIHQNVLPAKNQIEQKTHDHPTEFSIEITDHLSQVTDKETDAAIDNYVIDKRNKWKTLFPKETIIKSYGYPIKYKDYIFLLGKPVVVFK